MAYDEELATRIRELIGDEPLLTEQKMFGGLSFLLAGNLAVAASGWGGLLVRVGPEAADELVESTAASVPVMGSRPMKGWLHLEPDDLATESQLREWVTRGIDFASALPPKQK